MRGGPRRTLRGVMEDSGVREPLLKDYDVLNLSSVQLCRRVFPYTFWMPMTRTVPLPLPHLVTSRSCCCSCLLWGKKFNNDFLKPPISVKKGISLSIGQSIGRSVIDIRSKYNCYNPTALGGNNTQSEATGDSSWCPPSMLTIL